MLIGHFKQDHSSRKCFMQFQAREDSFFIFLLKKLNVLLENFIFYIIIQFLAFFSYYSTLNTFRFNRDVIQLNLYII